MSLGTQTELHPLAISLFAAHTPDGVDMNTTGQHEDTFESALRLLLGQQRDALRTILALSDTTRRHDATSARAALAEIFQAADRCHSTYRAMLVEIMATQRASSVSPEH